MCACRKPCLNKAHFNNTFWTWATVERCLRCKHSISKRSIHVMKELHASETLFNVGFWQEMDCSIKMNRTTFWHFQKNSWKFTCGTTHDPMWNACECIETQVMHVKSTTYGFKHVNSHLTFHMASRFCTWKTWRVLFVRYLLSCLWH